MLMPRAPASSWFPSIRGSCSTYWEHKRIETVQSAAASVALGRPPSTTSRRLFVSVTATVLVVVGCLFLLLSPHESSRSLRAFNVGWQSLSQMQHPMVQHEVQQQHRQLQQQQQQQSLRQKRLATPEDGVLRGRVPTVQQNDRTPAHIETRVAPIEKAATSTGADAPGPALHKADTLDIAPDDIRRLAATQPNSRYSVNYLSLLYPIHSVASTMWSSHHLHLLPWNQYGPPLFRAPILTSPFSPSVFPLVPFPPSSSPSSLLSSLPRSFSASSPSTAVASRIEEEQGASSVSAAIRSGKLGVSHSEQLQTSTPAVAAATTSQRISPSPSRSAATPHAVSSRSPERAGHQTLLRTLPVETRTSRSKKGSWNIQHDVQWQNYSQLGQHWPVEQRVEPERRLKTSLSVSAPERLALSGPATSSLSFSSATHSSNSSLGRASRRLDTVDSLLQMGSQFVMYPEMGNTLEQQLTALKRIFRGDSTADLKVPVYLSVEDDCLVAFDFVADQDSGDNYHLGRVSPEELKILISFAEHQGLLIYKERRQDKIQIAKLPVLHVQRFELPKNCLSTKDAAWTAYCTEPAPAKCYLGRVDLHLSELGNEDEITFVPAIPFSAYVQTQLQEGVTYSEILDRAEAPTPLLRMVFDDFRCVLHFRFHTVEPRNTLVFWLKNRQGIRLDVKDASTNSMTAKKTSLPPLCGAERPEDIRPTLTQLPDGTYKALVHFKRYPEYEETYDEFVEVERKKPDKRPETAFDYFNEKQLDFDKFFPEEDHVIPLNELPRVIEKQ